MPSYSSSMLRSDHFVPESATDPVAQRKLRGQLESIDYTAFASNREVIGHVLGHADSALFKRMAVACAAARARWVKEAMTIEELSSAYEATRRLVERGYLPFRAD